MISDNLVIITTLLDNKMMIILITKRGMLPTCFMTFLHNDLGARLPNIGSIYTFVLLLQRDDYMTMIHLSLQGVFLLYIS